MPARPSQGKVILYTTSTPSTRFQKTAIRNVTALLAAKNVGYEEACAPSRAHMVASSLPALLARAPCAAWVTLLSAKPTGRPCGGACSAQRHAQRQRRQKRTPAAPRERQGDACAVALPVT